MCKSDEGKRAYRINPEVGYYIDTCGTGGDGSNTFNTIHGNGFCGSCRRSCRCKIREQVCVHRNGSADVLESLGINIEIPPEMVKDCIEKVGIGFMFSPHFHEIHEVYSRA